MAQTINCPIDVYYKCLAFLLQNGMITGPQNIVDIQPYSGIIDSSVPQAPNTPGGNSDDNICFYGNLQIWEGINSNMTLTSGFVQVSTPANTGTILTIYRRTFLTVEQIIPQLQYFGIFFGVVFGNNNNFCMGFDGYKITIVP